MWGYTVHTHTRSHAHDKRSPPISSCTTVNNTGFTICTTKNYYETQYRLKTPSHFLLFFLLIFYPFNLTESKGIGCFEIVVNLFILTFFSVVFFYRKFVVLNTKYEFKKHKNWLYIVVAHLHCCCTVIKRLHCARSPTRHDKLAVCQPSGQIKKPVEDDEFSRLLNAIIQET